MAEAPAAPAGVRSNPPPSRPPPLRSSPGCIACGEAPTITADSLPSYDYAAFTGQAPTDAAPAPLQLIPREQRITPGELQQRCDASWLRQRAMGGAGGRVEPGLSTRAADERVQRVALLLVGAARSHPPARCRLPRRLAAQPGALLLDVRPAEQFNVCHLPGALHAPYKRFDACLPEIRRRLAAAGSEQPAAGNEAQANGGEPANGAAQTNGAAQASGSSAPPPLYVVCRRGNDSQRAVAALRAAGISHAVDVVGGMEGWAREVDPGFPTY